MASAPSDHGPVLGRVDRDGRLVSADPELAALQAEAGSKVGAELALPQVAAIAKLARKLGVPVSRPAVAGGADRDVQVWVRATPDRDDILLSLDRWTLLPPAPPRLASLVGHEQDVEVGAAADEWECDEELRIVAVTSGLAEKLGISAAEAVGKPLTRLFKLEENESGELPLLAAVASRGDFAGQRAFPRGGGDGLLLLSGSVVTDGDGTFAGFKGEAVAEGSIDAGAAAAADFDQALDEALRSPLDRIIDAADRIVQQSDGPLRSDYAEYAGDIAVAARHLLSVIRSMSGEARDADRIDIAALAAEAAGMLDSAAEPRGIVIAIEPSGPVPAEGDSRGVIQILVNLIGNAVRHSPNGGTVSLSFELHGDRARVHVADQGPGIAEADQQRIFERFERAQADEGGTGLGLAIARRLARSMGGDIMLESAPGQGARFTLELSAA